MSQGVKSMRRLGTLLLVASCAHAPELVLPVAPKPPGPVLIASVRVFDGESSEARGPLDVLLLGGRIARIAPAGELTAPPGVERVLGEGRTLLPGLVDFHVHVGGGNGDPLWAVRIPRPEAQLEALLFSGVTTAVVAGHEGDVEGLARRIDRGELAGPRLYRSSRMITAVDGHPLPLYRALVPVPWPLGPQLAAATAEQVDTPAAAREAVRRNVDELGGRFVKVVYDAFPPGSGHLSLEALRAAIDEARSRGKRVLAHVGSPKDAVEAAEAGAWMLTHLPRQEVFTPEQVRRIAATGAHCSTTAVVFRQLDLQFNRRLDLLPLEREVAGADAEAAFHRRPERFSLPGFPPDFPRLLPSLDEATLKNLRLLREAGVVLVLGSDSSLPGILHGPGTHRELMHLVEAGIPPAEALRMATSIPARLLEEPERFGVVAEGARADLLLVEGDPLADISATQRIVAVWKAGHRVARQARR